MTEPFSHRANAPSPSPAPADWEGGLRSALAVFVKTPGLSPIKTRLAAEVGETAAAAFYQLAVDAVESTLTEVASTQIHPYWAVAEEAGMSDGRWQKFDRLSQGEGGLCERLGSVFENLQSRYDIVAVMGVDSPQVSAGLLREAYRILASTDNAPIYVLGRCHDGGFYCLGTNVSLPRSLWHDVEYSATDTAKQISRRLAPLGEIVELPRLSDVDLAGDLDVLWRELEAVADLPRAQQRLKDWLARQVIAQRLNQ